MTKTITILAIVLVGFGVQSAYACTEGNIQHWASYDFAPDDFGPPILHDTEPPITQAGSINLPVEPEEVLSIAKETQRLVDKLNVLGFFIMDPVQRPITIFDVVLLGTGIPVIFSTICKDGFEQIIGGLFIQPDSTAMFLAYGIANAIWIAPTMAGLAAGIYLTKSKWKR